MVKLKNKQLTTRHPGAARTWMLWGALTVAAVSALSATLVSAGSNRSVFLPGPTTHGHYQIELECGACHTDAFDSGQSLQKACESCHAEELQHADDSHPKAKFTDPRNAKRIEEIDARKCVACHAEHNPEATLAAGLTLPEDFCFRCHADVADDRPTHVGLGFDTCASAGCHNFHDNKGLYEDYLAEHLDEPAILADAGTPVLTSRNAPPAGHKPSLAGADQDGPQNADAALIQQWAMSSHARAGTNCSDCHGRRATFTASVAPSTCETCHEEEYAGWSRGRHGMRVAAGLPPMQVSKARLPMKAEASHRTLDCGSCHSPHGFDPQLAAVDACMECHNDEHTKSFTNSKHFELWRAEQAGHAKPGSGVSCATCHMPRVQQRKGVFRVEHNQNNNLRPNDKMIRTVCTQCHGVGFAIDALADRELIRRNFEGLPSRHVQSVDYVRSRHSR